MKNKTLYNIISGILLQISVALTGILIPKLVMQYYGSALNGLTVSINQLISYLALVESGIGAVGIVALYAPLVQGNQKKISATVSAVSRLYRKSGLLYLAIVLVVGFLYPYLVAGQVDNVLATSLFFVLSCSNLIDYLFFGKYKTLLAADEKLYIVNGLQVIANVLNTVLSCVCILSGFSLVFVKAINVFLCIARLLVTYVYVKKHYGYLSLREKPDYSGLAERWDSLAHQISAIVVGNTDVLLLTVMLGAASLLEVSVYSTYNMVLLTINGLFGTLSSALQAHFGKLLLSDRTTLVKHFSIMEKLVFIVVAVAFSCTAVLILDFVGLYTEGVHDVNYYRPIVALVFALNGFLQNIRIPGVTMICAAGKYKETRNRAVMEAVINIVVSVALIPSLGILGALLGTSVSYLYRTSDVILYSNKLLENYPLRETLKSIAVAIAGTVFSCVLMLAVNSMIGITGWLSWIVAAFADVLIAAVVMAVLALVCYRELRRAVAARIKK